MTYQTTEQFIHRQEEIKYEFTNSNRRQQMREQHSRSINLVERSKKITKFIAELFNIGFVNSTVIKLCMKELLESPTELTIECFHILVTTVGAKLESEEDGTDFVNKMLDRLEKVVESSCDSICMKVRYKIVEIFELREVGWKSNEVKKAPVDFTQGDTTSAIVEKAKATREFLEEVHNILSRLKHENLLNFMDRFKESQSDIIDEERLEGAVKVIFENAISKPMSLILYAFVCKGLADMSAPSAGGGPKTFKDHLISLCQREIVIHSDIAKMNRSLTERVEALKFETNIDKAHRAKQLLDNDLKLKTRAHNATRFYGELFKADVIESRFILDYFVFLLSKHVVSNVSIECCCLLMTQVGEKILTEPNRVVLMKETIKRLAIAANSNEASPKSWFLVEDVKKRAAQLNLVPDDGSRAELMSYPKLNLPWETSLSAEPLWKIQHQTLKVNDEKEMINKHCETAQIPPGPPPLNLIHCLPSPKVSVCPLLVCLSSSWFLMNFLYFQLPTPYAIHQNVAFAVEQFKDNNRNHVNGGNNIPTTHQLVPIDFNNGHENINTTMLKQVQNR